MARGGKMILFWINVLLLGSCTDPFTPPSIQNDLRYLVVDGFLNSNGTDPSVFRLSHTEMLSNPFPAQAELDAAVLVEEENGPVFTFLDNHDGTYTLPPLSLNLAKNYRLRIVTQSLKEYVSDFVSAIQTPAIDSVSFKRTNAGFQDGLQVYVNTHDSENKAKYFLWTFDETWKYQAKYESGFVHTDSGIVRRQDQIYRCYKTVHSTKILLTATTALSKDFISEFPLTFIPFVNPRLSRRYSINVQQYALTKDAFEYWLTLQKNTENLGNLFGPLPSQSRGNITCTTNPAEPVMGYFTTTTKQQKRIFIDSASFVIPEHFDDGYQSCDHHTVPLDQALSYPTTDLFLYGIYKGIDLVAYEAASAYCSDCRLMGGVTAAPDFW